MAIESQPRFTHENGPNVNRNHRDEVVKTLHPYFEQQLKLLRPVENLWQPSDILPNLEGPDWQEKLHDFREEVSKLSDGFIAMIAFHGITEEGLPHFMSWQNRYDAVSDKTGIDDTPPAKFIRWWTAEENRHADTNSTYLKLSGRFPMRAYHLSVQSFLRNGFNPKVDPEDVYQGIIFTAGQEPRTQISSNKKAQKAKLEGSPTTQLMYGSIGGDEGRHGMFYGNVVGKIFEADPEGATISFDKVTSSNKGSQIDMPAGLMTEGEDATEGPTEFYKTLVKIEVALGGLNPTDSANILEKLIRKFNIENLSLSGEAAKAQENIMNTLRRSQRIARVFEQASFKGSIKLPWFEKPIELSPASV